MQSQLPKPKDDYTKSSNVTAAIEFAPRLQLSPTAQWVRKGLWIVTQVFVFLAQLFNYSSRFFNTYKDSLPGVALILAAFIALRVVSAVLAALNDIPLVAPAFQLIGIGYSIWFVTQHLLLASRRQELSQQIQGFLSQQRKEVVRTGESEQLYKPGQHLIARLGHA